MENVGGSWERLYLWRNYSSIKRQKAMKGSKVALLLLVVISCCIVIIYTLKNKYHSNLYYEYDIINIAAYVTNPPSGKVYKGNIVIPSTTERQRVAYDVIGILDRAFISCTEITSVEIPNSVTKIGVGAFNSGVDGCIGLERIQVDVNNPAYCDIDGVLYSKDKKQLIAYPNAKSNEYKIPDGVTKIGADAFQGCIGLTLVEIPNSVTKIGVGAFSGCTGLTSIKIPNSVTEIGDWAFNFCQSLTSVMIPNSVTKIGGNAFNGCTGLRSVSIPNSVTKISEGAFSGCTGLTSIKIPNSVTEIGDWAFSGCDNLKEIICKAVTPPNIVIWNDFSKKENLYVPKVSLEAYREHEVWGRFKEILPIEE